MASTEHLDSDAKLKSIESWISDVAKHAAKRPMKATAQVTRAELDLWMDANWETFKIRFASYLAYGMLQTNLFDQDLQLEIIDRSVTSLEDSLKSEPILPSISVSRGSTNKDHDTLVVLCFIKCLKKLGGRLEYIDIQFGDRFPEGSGRRVLQRISAGRALDRLYRAWELDSCDWSTLMVSLRIQDSCKRLWDDETWANISNESFMNDYHNAHGWQVANVLSIY